MHPLIMSETTSVRIADRRRQTELHAIARAARRAHRSPAPQRLRPAVALAGRVLAPLAARSRAMGVQARPQPGCPSAAWCPTCS
jgi:hypothetical protein